MVCHSFMAVVVSRLGTGLPLLPQYHCSSFSVEKLYFHCRAMKCLCMTTENCTINLTPAELTGQKPMRPLLGKEHYQCMDSLFIRGSIRHCSLGCHAEYETENKTMPAADEHSGGIVLNMQNAIPENFSGLKLRDCAILSKFHDAALFHKPLNNMYY